MTGKFIHIFLFLLFFYNTSCSSLSNVNGRSLCTSVFDNVPSKSYTPEEMVNDCKPTSTNEKYTLRDIRSPFINLKQSIFSNRMLFDQLRDPAGTFKIFQKFKNHVDASGRNRYHPAFTKTGFERMIKKTTLNKYKKAALNKRSENDGTLNKRNYSNDRYQRSDPRDPEGFSYDFVRFGKRIPSYVNKYLLYGYPSGMNNQQYKKSEKYQNKIFGKGGEQDKRGALESNNYDFVRFG